jgi:hypothetical protein
MQEKLIIHSRGANVQHVNMKEVRAIDVVLIPLIRTHDATGLEVVRRDGLHSALCRSLHHAVNRTVESGV